MLYTRLEKLEAADVHKGLTHVQCMTLMENVDYIPNIVCTEFECLKFIPVVKTTFGCERVLDLSYKAILELWRTFRDKPFTQKDVNEALFRVTVMDCADTGIPGRMLDLPREMDWLSVEEAQTAVGRMEAVAKEAVPDSWDLLIHNELRIEGEVQAVSEDTLYVFKFKDGPLSNKDLIEACVYMSSLVHYNRYDHATCLNVLTNERINLTMVNSKVFLKQLKSMLEEPEFKVNLNHYGG